MIEPKDPKSHVNWKDDCSWWGKVDCSLLFGLQGGHGGPTDREVQAAASLGAKTEAHQVASPKTRSNI